MITRKHAATAVVAALGVLALAAPATQAAPQRTPLYMTVLAPPAPVVGTDGRRHLAYELIVANEGGGSAEIQSVAVRANSGRTLETLGAAELPNWVSNSAFQPTRTFRAAEGGRVWLDVQLPRNAAVPRALVHRVRVRVTFADGTGKTYNFNAGRTPVVRRQAVVVSPPLRGGLYLNFNGCCLVSAHRRALVALDGAPFLSERFALDFVEGDAQGGGVTSDPSRNESFLTFGEPVLAVGDGQVVSTLNTLPEGVPFVEPPSSDFTEREILGNHVILRLASGRYASYAHLKRGSVRVRTGQRVGDGQVLAEVGNSGPSGGPHLHLQITDGIDPLASDGLPFVFRRFRLAGNVGNIPEVLTGQANADIQPAAGAPRRRGEMPLQGSVVEFAR
jgi:hypothetical protein